VITVGRVSDVADTFKVSELMIIAAAIVSVLAVALFCFVVLACVRKAVVCRCRTNGLYNISCILRPRLFSGIQSWFYHVHLSLPIGA